MNNQYLRCISSMVLITALSLSLIPMPSFAQVDGTTTRVSVRSDGVESNGEAQLARISTDGRYVAFASTATNLVSGDTNNQMDIFVHNRQTHVTERISVSSTQTQANGSSVEPSISSDGRYVAFRSSASNLVSDDTNGVDDIFVRDRLLQTTGRASVANDGGQSESGGQGGSISGDGRFVVFESYGAALVSNDTNNQSDIFVRDRQLGTTTRVSVSSNGTEANQSSYGPIISASSRYVVFRSSASNLITGDTNSVVDVFVRDLQGGTTERISVDSSGTQGNNDSIANGITPDGRYVVFHSIANNLVAGDTNGVSDVFVRDRQDGATERVSVSSNGVQGNAGSWWSSVSADGRYIVFHTASNTLVSGDTNSSEDVFIRDRIAQTIERVSVSSSGSESNGYAVDGSISADGRTVAFVARASNLVAGDTNNIDDAFVRLNTDNDFRPNPHGFYFKNPTGNSANITTQVMIDLFTKEKVCDEKSPPNGCNLRPTAREWRERRAASIVNSTGNCLGMAVQSLRLFRDHNGQFDTYNTWSTPDVKLPAINVDSIKQETVQFNTEFDKSVYDDPPVVLNNLRQALLNHTPVVLNMQTHRWYDPGHLISGAHAVAPYAIEDKGGGVYWIKVYDSNTPGDANRYVEVNTNNRNGDEGSWTFQMKFQGTQLTLTWSGTGKSTTNRMYIIPLKVFDLSTYTMGGSTTNTVAISPSVISGPVEEVQISAGNVAVMFTDPSGRRLGFESGNLINEIPGAGLTMPLVNDSATPVYRIPVPYVVHLNATGTESVDGIQLVKFSGGNVIVMDSIAVQPGKETAITVSADGRTAEVSSGLADSVSLYTALDKDPAGNGVWYRMRNIDLPTDGKVQLSVSNTLQLDLSRSSSGAYDLEVNRISSTGVMTFTAQSIPVIAGDVQSIGYQTWNDGSQTMPINIENPTSGNRSGDLINDQPPVISYKTYIPLIRR